MIVNRSKASMEEFTMTDRTNIGRQRNKVKKTNTMVHMRMRQERMHAQMARKVELPCKMKPPKKSQDDTSVYELRLEEIKVKKKAGNMMTSPFDE